MQSSAGIFPNQSGELLRIADGLPVQVAALAIDKNAVKVFSFRYWTFAAFFR